jgi:hypothetical protein
MNPTMVVVLILLLVLVGGAIYLFMNREPEPEPEPAPAPTPAPVAVVTPVAVPSPAEVAAVAAAQEELDAVNQELADMSVVRTHPFTGNKFLISKKTVPGVIVPKLAVGEPASTFDIVTTGVRTDDMMVEFKPIENEPDTYYLYSSPLERYIKYNSTGFGYRATTPTTIPYKIKFTSLNDEYVMSYTTTSGVEMFFGYDVATGTMISSESVLDIVNSGLVNVEDGDVAGTILPGNFGTEFFTYGTAELGNIQDCLTNIDEVDIEDKSELLSVAYKNPGETEDAPCRAYKNGDSYGYMPEAEGWVTSCIDNTKSVKQGCLL